MNDAITRSPGFTRDTSGPTSSTVPEPSWPRMIGTGIGTPPVCTVRSEWHTPLASICTRTSRAPSAGSVSSSMTSGWLYSLRTAARIVPPWVGVVRRA